MTLPQTSESIKTCDFDEALPLMIRTYRQEQLKNKFFQQIIERFMMLEEAGLLTKAQLARRIGKRPEQITRLLGASGNMTLNSVSDLVAGLDCDVEVSICQKAPPQHRNHLGAAQWLHERSTDNVYYIPTNSNGSSEWKVLETA